MSESSGTYLLLWKGTQSGPFGLEEIRSKLEAGDISRMHQIQVNGGWQILDEFLSKLRAAELEKQRAESRQRLKREAETIKAGAAAGSSRDYERGGEAGEGAAESAPPASIASRSKRTSRLRKRESEDEDYDAQLNGRTSGLAIAAFVIAVVSFVITVAAGIALSSQISPAALALCNLVPVIDIIAWIVGLILGHMSLRQMDDDESLQGRTLAIAGLVLTYFLIVVGLTVAVLMVINHQKFVF